MDNGSTFNALSGTIDFLFGAGILFGFWRIGTALVRRGRKESK